MGTFNNNYYLTNQRINEVYVNYKTMMSFSAVIFLHVVCHASQMPKTVKENALVLAEDLKWTRCDVVDTGRKNHHDAKVYLANNQRVRKFGPVWVGSSIQLNTSKPRNDACSHLLQVIC